MGEDMFVMRCIGRYKLALGTNLATILAYNKMHACIFLKITISYHLYLIGFKIFKVRAYILGFWVFFITFKVWI
jgi:hypothetical protein